MQIDDRTRLASQRAPAEERRPADVGADVVYTTPVFPGESNHRYNATTFTSVDPLLGGDEAFAALVEAAKQTPPTGLDVVLMIGLALPAGTALCSDQRAMIEAALVALGLPREAIDGRDTARSRGP